MESCFESDRRRGLSLRCVLNISARIESAQTPYKPQMAATVRFRAALSRCVAVTRSGADHLRRVRKRAGSEHTLARRGGAGGIGGRAGTCESCDHLQDRPDARHRGCGLERSVSEQEYETLPERFQVLLLVVRRMSRPGRSYVCRPRGDGREQRSPVCRGALRLPRGHVGHGSGRPLPSSSLAPRHSASAGHGDSREPAADPGFPNRHPGGPRWSIAARDRAT
jgi:hypothetical protein